MQVFRSHALACLAVLGTAGALPAQSPAAPGEIAYAPASKRYHLVSVVTRTQEHGGQKTQLTITNEQRVSVSLAAHGKDTLDFAYTLDSTHLTTNPPIELPDLSKMQGTKVSGSMSRAGKVYAYKSSITDEDVEARNLVEGMTKFLVVLPPGAKVGSTWTDTSTNSVKSEGNNVDMSTITTSRILGDTTFGGERAWRVERNSVLSLKGDQNQAGQVLNIEGEGKGSGIYYLSTAGIYLGSSAKQRMNMKVMVPSTGETIPVVQEVSSKVELVK